MSIVRDVDLIGAVFGTEYHCHGLFLREQERWGCENRCLHRIRHFARLIHIHISRIEYLLPDLETHAIPPDFESGDFKFTSPILDGDDHIREELHSFIVITQYQSISRKTSGKWLAIFCDRDTCRVRLTHFYIIPCHSETHGECASFEKFIRFLFEDLFSSLDRTLFDFGCCLGFLLEIFYRGKFSITLEESNRINRIGREIIPTESLIDDRHRILPLRTGHIIVRVILSRCINLEMEVIPVRIPRIPHFSDDIPCFDRSLGRDNLGEMGIIGIHVRPIGELVFDRDGITPPILHGGRNHLSIPD